MKNILLKSVVIFVVMTLLNAQFTAWSLNFIEAHGGIGMAPISIFLTNLLVSAIGFITILIFRNAYNSVIKIAVLFEIIYLVTLIISGVKPFEYFFNKDEIILLDFLIYLNSFIVLFIMYLLHFLYSKIITSKSKN